MLFQHPLNNDSSKNFWEQLNGSAKKKHIRWGANIVLVSKDAVFLLLDAQKQWKGLVQRRIEKHHDPSLFVNEHGTAWYSQYYIEVRT